MQRLLTGPDFVIIGAMKCATSTIHDLLASVPGISMSEPKEPGLFADPRNWEHRQRWYESLFASMPEHDLKGESSTDYTKLPTHPDCARRLHEYLPNARLVYVMRDPVDRVVSHYVHEWSQCVIARRCSLDNAVIEHPSLLDYSKYAMQLKPYFEAYGRSAVLPVFFERVVEQPQRELERIARHIGHDRPVPSLPGLRQNESAERLRCGPILDAILSFRWVGILRRTVLPKPIRRRIRLRWTMQQRPSFDAATLERVREDLDRDLAELGRHLGRELNCQNFAQQVRDGAAPEWVDSYS